jgi:hypothetical protein
MTRSFRTPGPTGFSTRPRRHPLIRKKLIKAGGNQRLITVVRRKRWVRYTGYVVAVSKDWVALRTLTVGLVVLRVDDISTLTKGKKPNKTRRALRRRGEWPPSVPAVLDVWDLRSLLFTAGSLTPLVTIGTEVEDRKAVHAGTVFRITDKNIHLSDGTKIKLADITRLSL